MMPWYGGMSGWGMAFMALTTFILLGLLVAGVIALVHYTTSRDNTAGGPAAQAPTPQQILAERFSRGEIDEEEYRRRLQVLTGA